MNKISLRKFSLNIRVYLIHYYLDIYNLHIKCKSFSHELGNTKTMFSFKFRNKSDAALVAVFCFDFVLR